MTVKDVVVFLDKIGMWDVVLPFVLVFTVVYAVLEKTKVLGTEFGEPKHRFNAIAAFVVAFFTLIAVDVLNIVSRLAQYMVILLVAGVCTAIIVSFFGFKDIRKFKWGKKLFLPVAFIIFAIVVLYALGMLDFFDFSDLSKYIGVIIGIGVFVLVLWFILRGKETEAEAEAEKRPAAAAAAPAKEKTEEEKVDETIKRIINQLPSPVKEMAQEEYEIQPDLASKKALLGELGRLMRRR